MNIVLFCIPYILNPFFLVWYKIRYERQGSLFIIMPLYFVSPFIPDINKSSHACSHPHYILLWVKYELASQSHRGLGTSVSLNSDISYRHDSADSKQTLIFKLTLSFLSSSKSSILYLKYIKSCCYTMPFSFNSSSEQYVIIYLEILKIIYIFTVLQNIVHSCNDILFLISFFFNIFCFHVVLCSACARN